MNVKEAIKQEISESLNKYLKSKIIKPAEIFIEYPENISHGDFSTNSAMIYFKDVSLEGSYRSPREFATAIAEDLNKSEELTKFVKAIEVAGPGFINFILKDEYFAEVADLIVSDISQFARPVQVNKKVSIEHTDMNPNKELHVGHLRNSCIGESIVNLLKYSGRDVTVQYYQNDAGLQISSIVLAYKERFINPDNFEKLHKWAAVAYVDIEKRIENDKVLSGKRSDIQVNISKQDNEDARLAKQLTDEILRNVLETMSEMGVYFDLVVCESEIIKNKIWEQAFEILKKSPSFYKSEEGSKAGCWLVKMPDAEDKVFVRSNGIPNYVATDFAYELWKFGLLDDFRYEQFPLTFYEDRMIDITSSTGTPKSGYNKAEEVYLVVDVTQSYPQESIVEAMKVLGYKEEAENYHHIAYGFVYLSSKTAAKLNMEVEDISKPIKMSGRKGTVVSVDTFLQEIESALVDKFGQFANLKAVRNGAIKFELLKNNTYQDMSFDLDAAIDNKGFTGPYIQYTYARAKSILRKSKNNPSSIISMAFNKDELKLLKIINRLPEEISLAISELSPHYICHYMYEVSQAYNAFYNSNQVIGSDREDIRVALTQVVANVLGLGLSLLGIESPESI